MAWSPDGRALASGGYGGTTCVWHVASSTCTATLEVSQGLVVARTWMHPIKRARALDGTSNKLWYARCSLRTPRTPRAVSELSVSSAAVECMCRAGHQPWLHSRITHSRITWSNQLESLHVEATLMLILHACLHILYSRPGPLQADAEWVKDVDWSPDGRRLACGYDTGNVCLWDVTAAVAQQRSGKPEVGPRVRCRSVVCSRARCINGGVR